MEQLTQPKSITAAKPRQISKKERLLANPDVKRWYDNLARASEVTANVRLRRLGHFCEVHKMTPMELADLAMKDLKSATDLVQDHVTAMEDKGNASGYIESTLTAVKSWIRHFDIELKRKIRITNAGSTPTLQDERVPIEEEMSLIFEKATLKSSACISLLAKAGLRPQVLGNFNGTDGLMLRDLPDIAIAQGVCICKQYPPRVTVRRTLSKAKHQYFTYMTRNGTKSLLASLNDRILQGEVLTPNSPVIAPDPQYHHRRGSNNGKKFLPTTQVSKIIRETFREAGFQWRPYVLRAYFDTQMLIAEARGKIAHDFRVFFMGHKGSIEATYTVNKGILPDNLLKEMREGFMRCEEFLDLEGKTDDPLYRQKEAIKEKMLTALEIATPEQLGKMQEMVEQFTICKVNQANG